MLKNFKLDKKHHLRIHSVTYLRLENLWQEPQKLQNAKHFIINVWSLSHLTLYTDPLNTLCFLTCKMKRIRWDNRCKVNSLYFGKPSKSDYLWSEFQTKDYHMLCVFVSTVSDIATFHYMEISNGKE